MFAGWAGRRDDRRGGAAPPRLALVVAFALVFAAGCRHARPEAPTELLDGSHASGPPRALERLGEDAVLTRVRLRTAAVGQRGGVLECLRRAGVEPDERLLVVERVGLSGHSVTFPNRALRGVSGCDATAGATEHGGHWCASSFGALRRGRLLDPRLSIGCVDRRGGQVGFAWIAPLRGARWIAVDDAGRTELYEVAARLPVRVTTRDVQSSRARAVFKLRQYAADGRELTREVLEAHVAG